MQNSQSHVFGQIDFGNMLKKVALPNNYVFVDTADSLKLSLKYI